MNMTIKPDRLKKEANNLGFRLSKRCYYILHKMVLSAIKRASENAEKRRKKTIIEEDFDG